MSGVSPHVSLWIDCPSGFLQPVETELYRMHSVPLPRPLAAPRNQRAGAEPGSLSAESRTAARVSLPRPSPVSALASSQFLVPDHPHCPLTLALAMASHHAARLISLPGTTSQPTV